MHVRFEPRRVRQLRDPLGRQPREAEPAAEQRATEGAVGVRVARLGRDRAYRRLEAVLEKAVEEMAEEALKLFEAAWLTALSLEAA